VPSRFSARIELACRAYNNAVHVLSDVRAEARESAAAEFKELAVDLGASGDAREIVPQVVARLDDADGCVALGAARLLAALPFREATEALLAAYARGARINVNDVRYLGRAAPLKEEDWDALANMHPGARPQMVFALLRSPSVSGRRRFAEILAGGDNVLGEYAITAVARWHEPRLLRMVMETWKPPPSDVTPFDPPDFHPSDLRLEAAFRLALDGDRSAVEFLMDAATPPTQKVDDRYRAVDAAIHLGALAWPEAVAPVAKLLESRSRYVLEMTLDAASALRAAALVPALLDLAARATRSPYTAEQALQVVEEITGREPNPSEQTENAATRQKMILKQRTALLDLDPALRYFRGTALGLGSLADELTSPHAGPIKAAAYNLRAITGEDGGFDPDDDLVENLGGLAFWRERARRPGPIDPGGWAFAGERLPSPQPPDSDDRAQEN
jgi:hypothetical protein